MQHLVHLHQELAFTGFLDAEIEAQGSLFHVVNFLKRGLLQAHNRGAFAKFP